MPPPRIIRDFRTVIELCARGRLVERLDEKLGAVLDALADSVDEKASASLSLTLDLQRVGDRIDIKPKVAFKPPPDKAVPATPLFFAEGGLSLQHPSQVDMFAGPRVASKPLSRSGEGQG